MRPNEINKIVEYIKEQTDHKGDIFININSNAIPIDWIHDYLDNTFLPESHFWVIQKMIKKWEEELHEKDI